MMCRIFLQVSNQTDVATGWLSSFPNSLLHQSLRDSSGRPNADGWGIGSLSSENRWMLLKSEKAAFLDPQYKLAAQNVKGKIIVAHVRRGSVGSVAYHNSHPFIFNEWLFVHNGNIPEFKTNPHFLRDRINYEFRDRINGETDSEAFFYVLLSLIQNTRYEPEMLLPLLADTIHEIAKGDIYTSNPLFALTFFLANPEHVIGLRLNRSLYYFHDHQKILVASEPIKDYNRWREINERDFFVIRNNRIEFYPIEQLLKIKV
jgi:glutamine amidotransferase